MNPTTPIDGIATLVHENYQPQAENLHTRPLANATTRVTTDAGLVRLDSMRSKPAAGLAATRLPEAITTVVPAHSGSADTDDQQRRIRCEMQALQYVTDIDQKLASVDRILGELGILLPYLDSIPVSAPTPTAPPPSGNIAKLPPRKRWLKTATALEIFNTIYPPSGLIRAKRVRRTLPATPLTAAIPTPATDAPLRRNQHDESPASRVAAQPRHSVPDRR
jgi:hypothetical protein